MCEPRPSVRNTDPETSHQAWEGVKNKVTKRQAQVVGVLRELGPRTCREIAFRLGLDRDSVSPRIPALREMGLVRDSGERRSGETVWRAIPCP